MTRMFIKSARTVFALVTLLLVFASAHSTFAAELDRQIVPAKPEGRLVDQEVMQKIYDEVKTPFKYGVVLQRDGTNEMIDCPSVFRFGERWCMMYVAITNKVGYQTFLANSDALLHWRLETGLRDRSPFHRHRLDARPGLAETLESPARKPGTLAQTT